MPWAEGGTRWVAGVTTFVMLGGTTASVIIASLVGAVMAPVLWGWWGAIGTALGLVAAGVSFVVGGAVSIIFPFLAAWLLQALMEWDDDASLAANSNNPGRLRAVG